MKFINGKEHAMKKSLLFVAWISLVGAAVPFGWGAIINGSFELGPPIVGDAVFVGGGSTDINGWIVTGHSVEVLGPPWDAFDGNRCLDLSGYDAGGVQQTFSTIPGMTYAVTFNLAGNPEGPPQYKQVRVSVDSFQHDYEVNSAGQTRYNLDWIPISFQFVASGSSATLWFKSQQNDAYGPLLDNVAVLPVPEPDGELLLATSLCLLAAVYSVRPSHLFGQ
ncbi:MAG: choice-of-anchor C family protein [Verrucomicrobiae bacterium]|nr:choice-of-anchor C family protein [Verrucomicrobiae bacterium]